jgi:lipopolysaccharide transport system ATP-binding protein
MIDAKPAVQIENVCKSYKLYNSPRDSIMEAITGKQRHTAKHVISDINLELARGDSLGILGRNGAGKSTLLKLIAGTLQPTSGKINVNGRVTAILELGSGFDPMVSGRENIMMGGLCLGMSREEVHAKIDKIIAFSELEAAIDQPFRTYSSGMQARLTFATAIHTDPDILIVDEALAVGDVRFQVKCFARIRDIQANGATILLVTHETNSMVRLCNRGIILEDGAVYLDAPAEETAKAYTQLIFSDREANPSLDSTHNQSNVVSYHATETDANGSEKSGVNADAVSQSRDKNATRYGDRTVEYLSTEIADKDGAHRTEFEAWDEIEFRVRLRFNESHPGVVFGIGIRDRSASIVYSTSSMLQTGKLVTGAKGDEIEAIFKGRIPLAGGNYFVFFSLADAQTSVMLDYIENAYMLSVSANKAVTEISIVDFGLTFDSTQTGESMSISK